MKKKKLTRLILALSVLISASLLSPMEKISLAGHWEGAIELPGMKLEINLDFTQAEDGTWQGDISIPAQNAKDLPLAKITLDGLKTSFVISGVPGDPTFQGALSEDGQTISGQFSQAGQTFPFRLSREIDPVTRARQSLSGLDDVLNKALQDFKVPGLAMAVVKDKEAVLVRGYGFRDLENKLPMTPDTLLAIGSASKAFTTFALGRLSDEGKVEWDKPLRNYIPWFKLTDSVLAERLTPRDLVTHRSGLPRHDLVWYNNYEATREELVRRLAYLQPTADLRQRFQYNNLMYLTAGHLVEILTGQPWEEAIRSLVLAPLDMKRTNFSVDDSQKDKDFAQPYRYRQEKLERIPFRKITNMGPAGSINSSVNEMSHWLLVHLNNGKFQDKQIINAVTLQDMHLAHMPVGSTPSHPEISPPDYGLGWFVDVYRGHRRVHHGGNIDGFSAMVALFPQDGFGFVALANMNGTPLPELAIRTAIDRLLGLEPIDWLGEAAKRQAEGEEAQKKAEARKLVRRKPNTTPAHKLEEYAGDYVHSGYGELKVFLKGGKLAFLYNNIETPLEHWHYETFAGGKAKDPTFENIQMTFQTDVNGNVAAVAAPFEPTADEIVFRKKPPACYFDPAFLKKFEGTYELVGQRYVISLKGDVLTLFVPGQPVLELVPELGDEFSLKQVKIVRLKFILDAKGEVTHLELSQPGGVFEAKKIKTP